MKTLYLVATPIGNLEDITLRAIRVLGEVALIAAEDTRTTRRLLDRYNIKTPLTSYFEQGKKRSKLPHLLAQLEEKDVALVSEAGMPGISDPGYDLVLAAIERDVKVIPIPGPSVLPAALAVSGLPADQFVYLGFLPRKRGERKHLLQEVSTEHRTVAAFESPHRLQASLADIREVLGDRRIVVCRELTKIHEEVFRGTVSEAIVHFTQPRGEFTFVIAGSPGRTRPRVDEQVQEEVRRLRTRGLPAKEAVELLAATTGLPRNMLYRVWLETAQ